MKIGVTGTRHGATLAQVFELDRQLILMNATELHHGDCCGADSQAHDAAKRQGIRVIGHPPIESSLRAFRKFDEERPMKDYIARNHDIVDEVDILIALPDSENERLRSGTWATVRYARKTGRSVTIITPEGVVR